MADHARGEPTFTVRHLLIWLGLFFGVIIAVNVTFIYFALTSFSGVETEDAYRKGVAYNQRLAAAEKDAALGWSGSLSVDAGAPLLVLKDGSGAPVMGAVLAAKAGRPSVDKFDRTVTFSDLGGGRYGIGKDVLEPGTWIVIVEARKPESASTETAPVLRLKERLWLAR